MVVVQRRGSIKTGLVATPAEVRRYQSRKNQKAEAEKARAELERVFSKLRAKKASA